MGFRGKEAEGLELAAHASPKTPYWTYFKTDPERYYGQGLLAIGYGYFVTWALTWQD